MVNFRGFRRFLIHGKSSYVVLTQCLRYNICSAWFLDIRISTCLSCCIYFVVLADLRYTFCVAGLPNFEGY